MHETTCHLLQSKSAVFEILLLWLLWLLVNLNLENNWIKIWKSWLMKSNVVFTMYKKRVLNITKNKNRNEIKMKTVKKSLCTSFRLNDMIHRHSSKATRGGSWDQPEPRKVHNVFRLHKHNTNIHNHEEEEETSTVVRKFEHFDK